MKSFWKKTVFMRHFTGRSFPDGKSAVKKRCIATVFSMVYTKRQKETAVWFVHRVFLLKKTEIIVW